MSLGYSNYLANSASSPLRYARCMFFIFNVFSSQYLYFLHCPSFNMEVENDENTSTILDAVHQKEQKISTEKQGICHFV